MILALVERNFSRVCFFDFSVFTLTRSLNWKLFMTFSKFSTDPELVGTVVDDIIIHSGDDKDEDTDNVEEDWNID